MEHIRGGKHRFVEPLHRALDDKNDSLHGKMARTGEIPGKGACRYIAYSELLRLSGDNDTLPPCPMRKARVQEDRVMFF